MADYGCDTHLECTSPRNKEELFNLWHANLQNIIERIFGVLKQQWQILCLPPEFSMEVQARIPVALCAIHNFIQHLDPDIFLPPSSKHNTWKKCSWMKRRVMLMGPGSLQMVLLLQLNSRGWHNSRTLLHNGCGRITWGSWDNQDMYNHDMFFFVKRFGMNDTYPSHDWMVDCTKKIHIPFPLQWCPLLEVTHHRPTDRSHQGSPTVPTVPSGTVSLKVCQWVAKAKVRANHTLWSQTEHYGPQLKSMNSSSCFLTTVHLPRMVSRMRHSTRSHQNSIKSSLLNRFQRCLSPVRGNGSMYGFIASQDCRSDIDSLYWSSRPNIILLSWSEEHLAFTMMTKRGLWLMSILGWHGMTFAR